MATVQYRYKTVDKGERCTGKVTLSCGHRIEETFIGRDRDKAREEVSRMIDIRTRGHIKWCKKDH